MNDSLKKFDKVLADVELIKEEGNFLPDCSTKDGYNASKDFVLKTTTPARTALNTAHKEAKAFYLEGGRMVDSKKNELMVILEEIQKPHQEAYKAVDEKKKAAKAAKEAAIQNGFDELKGYAEQALNQNSDFINSLIDDCSDFDADPKVYGKEIDKVIALHQKTMEQLTGAMTQALQFEDMQSKQAAMEEKQAKIDAKELEQKEAQEAQEKLERDAAQREQMRKDAEDAAAAETERLRLEAEQAKVDAVAAKNQAAIDAEQAEQLRIQQAHQAEVDAADAKEQAIQQAKDAADYAAQQERQRQADEQARIQAEADAREADKKHKGSINRAVMGALIVGGMDADQAKLAVKLIAARKIPHVKISY